MKVKIGDEVDGEFSNGKVIAMTKEFCIYKHPTQGEFAEIWESISIPVEPSEEVHTQITEREI